MSDDGATRSIHMSSSLHFDTLAAYRAAGDGKPILQGQTIGGVDNGYGLQGNPTFHELQTLISNLEHGQDTLLYPSGLTALAALSALLSSGDHWLLPDSVYGPFRRYAEYLDKHYNISFDCYSPDSVQSAADLLKKNTKLIHIESPASVTFELTDVDAITKLAKDNNILTSADNTWASGVLYHPLDHGVDISILSLTKYIAGYSDVFMGSVTCKNPALFKQLSYHHRVYGYSVSPFSTMLVSRGLESLATRLVMHGANASQLVKILEESKKVTRIFQAITDEKADISGTNGLLSIELDHIYNDAELEKAFAGLKVFKIGESWGGTRSMVLPFQPAELCNRLTPPNNTIIRFHAGLEDVSLQLTDIINFLAKL